MPSRQRRSIAAAAITALTASLLFPAVALADSPVAPVLPDDSTAETTHQSRPGASTPVSSFGVPSAEAPAEQSSRLAPSAISAPAEPEVTISKVTTSKVEFSWTEPVSDDGPITGYRVQLSSGGAVLLDVTTTDGADLADRSGVISQLDPETDYEISVAAINAGGTGAFSAPAPFTTLFSFVERQYGQNRFETAARVSYRAFPYSGVPAAFLANGLNFPDALSAAAAAGAIGGPVLLTAPTAYPDSTAAELTSLQPQYLFAAGGPASVSGSVLKKASAAATVDTIRLAGSDRYSTAADVSYLWEDGSAPVVYLASGTNFPDALAGAAAAGSMDSPVLLTAKDALPAATAASLKRLKPKRVVVLGGTGSISSKVASKAKAATGVTTSIVRQAGADRYSTAVAVSKAAFPTPGVPVVYIANGTSFADALAGAAAAGHRGGPVLLTSASSMPASVVAELKRLNPDRVVVLGGPSVVSNNVVKQISSALGR